MLHLPYFLSGVIIANILITSAIDAAPLIDNQNHAEDGDIREKRETFDMLNFLSQFGYLETSFDDDGVRPTENFQSEDVIIEAIKDFQRFNGLEVTGIPDRETMTKMKKPRCGMPDIIRNNSNANNGNAPMAYHTTGTRWGKDTVTWKPTKFTDQLSEGQQWMAFQKSLDLWASVIPIKFRYSPHEPDMEIRFARGDHGDGWQNKFDGKGNVLAHAFGPGYGAGGDTHFDEDENWTIDTGEGADLTTVAAHEFGHALGLGHSSVPGALMAPFYIYFEDLKLHQDDIQGIQSLYGRKYRPETTPKPTTTTSTTTTTTTTTTPDESGEAPWTPAFCSDNFRLDAVSDGPDGFLYAYRDDQIYKIGPNGLEFGFPKYITEVFSGAPRRHLRAVSYVPEHQRTYMFKNSQVWRFTDFKLDAGYPRVWTDDHYYRPSAALTLTYRGNSQIFLFGHNYFWEWSPYTETIVPGYPLPLDKYFPHAPMLPDAAFMNSQGNFIFFKYNNYKQMEHRGMDSDSRLIGPNVFGSLCGGRASLLRSQQTLFLSDQTFSDYSPVEIPEPEFSPMIWTLINENNSKQDGGALDGYYGNGRDTQDDRWEGPRRVGNKHYPENVDDDRRWWW